MEGLGVTVAGVTAGEDILLFAHAPTLGPGISAANLVAGRDVALDADGRRGHLWRRPAQATTSSCAPMAISA